MIIIGFFLQNVYLKLCVLLIKLEMSTKVKEEKKEDSSEDEEEKPKKKKKEDSSEKKVEISIIPEEKRMILR